MAKRLTPIHKGHPKFLIPIPPIRVHWRPFTAPSLINPAWTRGIDPWLNPSECRAPESSPFSASQRLRLRFFQVPAANRPTPVQQRMSPSQPQRGCAIKPGVVRVAALPRVLATSRSLPQRGCAVLALLNTPRTSRHVFEPPGRQAPKSYFFSAPPRLSARLFPGPTEWNASRRERGGKDHMHRTELIAHSPREAEHPNPVSSSRLGVFA